MRRTRILVVDDEEVIVAAVREMLERDGMEVISARNGVQALALAETQELAAIVVDLMMPVMGGWELIRRLRESAADHPVPVLIFSAMIDLEREAARLGVRRFIRKPCEITELLTAVHETLSDCAA